MRLAGFLAIAAILLVFVRDWKRGRTGFGKLVLTREHNPERYWLALVAYLNMAFVMFWLVQHLEDRSAGCDPGQSNCVVLIIEEPE